jgi:hypothetical protein
MYSNEEMTELVDMKVIEINTLEVKFVKDRVFVFLVCIYLC